MKKILSFSICFILSLSCFTASAMSKAQYQTLVNDIVQKVEATSGQKLKVKFQIRSNDSIRKSIADFEQYSSSYMEKETVSVLDGTSQIYIYRSNLQTDYRYAYIVIPDEGLTTGHPAIIDVSNDGKVWVEFDLKSLILEGNIKL